MKLCIPIFEWETPASKIPEQRVGDYRIKKRKIEANTVFPMNRVLGYDYYLHTQDTLYTELQQKVGRRWRTWMLDSPVEWYGMGEFALRARSGKVLVGGLGLGLVVHHLVNRRDINQIVVVEVSREVIDMVMSYLPEGEGYVYAIDVDQVDKNSITVLNMNFFKAVPKLSDAGFEFDTVIADLWAGKKEDPKVKETFEDARMVLEDSYMDSLHLFWGFHYEVDSEQSYQCLHYALRKMEEKERSL